RQLDQGYLDFSTLEAAIDERTPALPPLASDHVDVARIVRALLENPSVFGRWAFGGRIARLLALHGEGIGPVLREALAAGAGLRDPLRRSAQAALLEELAPPNPARAGPLPAPPRAAPPP